MEKEKIFYEKADFLTEIFSFYEKEEMRDILQFFGKESIL